MHRKTKRSLLSIVRSTAVLATASALILGFIPTASATPVNPIDDAKNIAMSSQRGAKILTDPAFVAKAAAAAASYTANRLKTILTDPERRISPNACSVPTLCVGDVRLGDWQGLKKPVLFTARNGAVLSGNVWATANGPAKRPGIFIINGSVAGYEQSYWWAAQSLANAGYVVLTFDVQGEGMSDQFGAFPDKLEGVGAGIPPFFGGLPFYDGAQDALNFFLSTPSSPYVPVPSRSTGTSHAAKQDRRVAQGRNAAFNPLWNILDSSSIGVAGHSYGAVGGSYLAQTDARIKTAVAWDSLCVPTQPAPREIPEFLSKSPNEFLSLKLPSAYYGFGKNCFGAPPGPQPSITKPALGINGDYLLPVPSLSKPDPKFKSQASAAYSNAGVDTGNITVRGGTHADPWFVANPAAVATLRGIDLYSWYTAAWFDKYLKGDPTADSRLTSQRWQNDQATKTIDPSKDGNLYSNYFDSRLDITLQSGTKFSCENLRTGCAGQPAATNDCGVADFGYLPVAKASNPTGRNVIQASCRR